MSEPGPRAEPPRRVEPVETSPSVASGGLDKPDPPYLATISDTPLDPAAIESFVLSPANGALVAFRGIVRDHDHGASVRLLEYSAHPDALTFLGDCCREVASRTGLRVAAAHRTGSLAIGDLALVAAVAAPHRAEAFAACADLVELIKQRVPIWKRQHLADGVTEWVGL